MNIDWGKFAERVPVGTHVSSVKGEVFDIADDWREVPYFGGGRCGILLSFIPENFVYIPDYFTNEISEKQFDPHMIVQPFEFVETVGFYDPTDLEYLVDGVWLTFEQVMS
jgi:hypothetical protein